MTSIGSVTWASAYQAAENFAQGVSEVVAKTAKIFFENIKNFGGLCKHLSVWDGFAKLGGRELTPVEGAVSGSLKHLKGWKALVGLSGDMNNVWQRLDTVYKFPSSDQVLKLAKDACILGMDSCSATSFVETLTRHPGLEGFAARSLPSVMGMAGIAGVAQTVLSAQELGRLTAEDQWRKKEMTREALKLGEGACGVLTSGFFFAGASTSSSVAKLAMDVLGLSGTYLPELV